MRLGAVKLRRVMVRRAIRSGFALAAGTASALGSGLSFAHAGELKAVITGVLDRGLRDEIQQTIGETKTPPQSALDARRRARAAASDTTELLRSEGYYEGTVEADVATSEPPRAVVRVTPGRRFRMKTGSIDWVGGMPTAADAKAVTDTLASTAGRPGRAADVIDDEERAVAALREHGYADARALPRQVIVDYADQTVAPTYRLSAGASVRMGAVELSGVTRSRLDFVSGLAPWRAGDVYSAAKLAKLEQRLLDPGAFETVTVSLAPADQAKNGLRPILVVLADRKGSTIELGAGYSTNNGSGVDGKYVLYNRLGRADSVTFLARGYDIQQKLDAELALPDWLRPDQIFKIGGGFLGNRTAAYSDIGGGLRMDVERHYTKTTFITLGGAFDYAATREKTAVNLLAVPVGVDLKLRIATGLAAFALDRSNDALNPTRGWRLEARVEPTWISGDRSIVYLRAQTQASGYLPLGPAAATVIAARFKIGSIWGGKIPDVPADRRFYVGGGGSVRGYGYQGVGLRLSDNTPQGGLSAVEASFEVRQRVTQDWGVVAFVDAGAVGTGPTPSFAGYGIGAGLGVRYNLGFAPVRVDVGTPLKPRAGDSRVHVYVSIGQSF